jgi:cytochrome c oxidase cbb3-type subunit 3
MSDMPTDFWAGWIAVITLVSLAALGWLVFSIYFSPADDHEESEGPVWDENLREGSHPAPLWWFWLILASMVFSVVYLMLYPGLGSYKGALRWSQGGNLENSLATYDAEFGSIRKLITEGNLDTLQDDPDIMRSAQRVFDRNCAVCHGYEAQGQADAFPSLVDDEWQWGGSPAQIEQSIVAGRNAVMVGWEQVLGEAGVANVANYVQVVGGAGAEGHPGQQQYNQFCVACHGPDGSGNPALGAPSLVDDIWLYGDSEDALRHSIAFGRSGEMPAFSQRLDATQIKLLVALLAQDPPAE